MNISIGMGILIGSILIAFVILYVTKRDTWNFKKLFSGMSIVFAITAILLLSAFWFLNHTQVNVHVNGPDLNPLNMLKSIIPGD